MSYAAGLTHRFGERQITIKNSAGAVMKDKFNAKLVGSSKVVYEQPCLTNPATVITGNCEIGAYSYIGDGSLIGSCSIGRFCSIAPGVKIALGEHPITNVSTHPLFFASKNGFEVPDGIGAPRDLSEKKYSKAIIGNDVWVGANAVICRGVTIGDGAVIAAGAVVTSDVAPYAVVGGLPARHLKFRFEAEVIQKLQDAKWWEYKVESFVGLPVSEPSLFVDLLLKSGEKASYEKVAVSNKEGKAAAVGV